MNPENTPENIAILTIYIEQIEAALNFMKQNLNEFKSTTRED